MKLHVLTLVLDGHDFLLAQLATLNRCSADFHWHCVEGAAMRGGSTSWCRPQEPRLSRDGTTTLLNSLRGHPRISIYQRQKWDSKDQMVNEPLKNITEPSLLLQMDVDEIWSAEQLAKLVNYFSMRHEINSAHFFCRYFVGPNLIITHDSDLANNNWVRAWRFQPGQTFVRHEPPVLSGTVKPFATREETRAIGLVFDHYAYLLQSSAAFKQDFYNYKDAVKHWQRLQANKKWPVRAKDFLPWAHKDSIADLLFKP